MDRGVVSLVKSNIQHDLRWNEVDYGNVVAAFSLAYAFGYLLGGRLMDVIGVRRGYALAVGLWSLAAIAHSLNKFISPDAKFTQTIPLTVAGFAAARMALGLAEGGNFPAAIKTVSEWFPKKERALATGIFNAGANIGNILTPITVWLILLRLNWPSCFLATGIAGILWVIGWLWLYREPQKHPRVSPEELAYIRGDPPDAAGKVSWIGLLQYRATWAFVIGTALSAPVWWFYLYWLPDFLKKTFHVETIFALLPFLVTVYLISDAGSIAGGWISSTLIQRGYSVNVGRKAALLTCAIAVIPVFFAADVQGKWTATLLIGLAAAAHQGFAANLYTLVSDTMPKRAVSSVVGIGGMAGGLVGMAFQSFSGHLLQFYHTHPITSYQILFGICACAYLVALAIMQILLPRLDPVVLPQDLQT